MSKINNQEPTGSYNDGHRQAPAVKYQPKPQCAYFDVGIGSVCLSGAGKWGKYCLLELGLAPGMNTLPHTHTREDEAYFVLSGELEVIVGKEVFLLRPGDTLIVPGNFPHQLRNSGKTENHFLIIFSPSGLGEFVKTICLPAPSDAFAPMAPPAAFKMSSIGQSTTESISKTQSFGGRKCTRECEWERAEVSMSKLE